MPAVRRLTVLVVAPTTPIRSDGYDEDLLASRVWLESSAPPPQLAPPLPASARHSRADPADPHGRVCFFLTRYHGTMDPPCFDLASIAAQTPIASLEYQPAVT